MSAIYIYCFIIGACCGSFVYAAAWRYLRKLDFVHGRSYCPHCHHPLAWYDLIPIVSWIWLRGKCRYCKTSLSAGYVLYELGTAVAAWLCVLVYGVSWEALCIFMVILILIAMATIDHASMIIPDGLQVLLIIPISALTFLHPHMSLASHLLGAFSVSGFMALMNCIVKNSFGGGDIKLMFLCGWGLGWQRIVMAAMIAVWTAGIYVLYLLGTKKVHRNMRIAFAPYLCIGIILVLYIDELIIPMI